MGGKNHQPCRIYLVNSTKLSRAMSLAFISIELANVSLENTILEELNEGRGDISPILVHLKQSKHNLQEMKVVLTDLCQQMTEESFQDLPTLKSVNPNTLGILAKQEGIHRSEQDWKDVATIMQEQGFWGITSAFKIKIDELCDLTEALHTKVATCSIPAKEGVLHLVLEENGKMNFKHEFACLYTAWAEFQQFFLASSLISTELWYQFNGLGSIINQPNKIQIVA